MNEDKQAICDALLYTLQLTRAHPDLKELAYERLDDGFEIVTAKWEGEWRAEKAVNVTADSGTAMIRDIMRWI